MEILNVALLIALLVITIRLLGPRCRKCDKLAPLFRIPKNGNEAWGGWTCTECGYEYYRWGEPVEKRPFPAMWSAQNDESHAPTVELQKTPITDIKRKDEYSE